VRARGPDAWTIERRGRALRAVRQGTATSWSDGVLTLRPDRDDEFGVFSAQRFRGAIRVVATDTGIVVVNVLPIEWYLRGVVPLEIGPRAPNEQAAAEAQAIAARSYAAVRMASIDASHARNANYDMLATVADQVYGGADAEKPFANQAVDRTAGLVLRYNGRVVSAPYHSTCGGETAAPEEVWREPGEPFLQRVSDRIPGTSDRFYCDISPRFTWTRTFTSGELDAAMRAYLGAYAAVPPGGPGHIRSVTVGARTPTGRVARLLIAAERGNYTVRGNDTRYVLRTPGSEILNSTYFSAEPELRSDGELARLVVKGNGYGHGIGMCQWGAIGRARAGQSARSILATYYPGTTVGQIN
jgi:stage II sporulation protein D